MRVWDIPINQLCNKHLVAQHHEIHCIASVHSKGLQRLMNHPEIKRWKHELGALHIAHWATVEEMESRGLKHHIENDMSGILHPADPNWRFYDDILKMPEPWEPIEKQKQSLLSKGCGCLSNGARPLSNRGCDHGERGKTPAPLLNR